MKMGIFALLLLTVIITLLTVFNISLKNSAEEISDITKDTIYFIDTGNYEKADENNIKAINYWKKSEKFYELMTEKSKLDIITASFDEATILVSQNRYDDSKLLLLKILAQLKHLIDENELNSETIL